MALTLQLAECGRNPSNGTHDKMGELHFDGSVFTITIEQIDRTIHIKHEKIILISLNSCFFVGMTPNCEHIIVQDRRGNLHTYGMTFSRPLAASAILEYKEYKGHECPSCYEENNERQLMICKIGGENVFHLSYCIACTNKNVAMQTNCAICNQKSIWWGSPEQRSLRPDLLPKSGIAKLG